MIAPSMMTTVVFKKTLYAYQQGKRLIVHQGGTWSSKTFSTLQVLILIAMTASGPLIISVVSESVPHLKRGVIRDLKSIMGDAFDDNSYNKTDSIYTFCDNTIEFFSADDASKLRGGRRDILFINECNNITKEAFDEMDVRTRLCTIVDFNPTCDFWLHEILTSKGIKDFSGDCSSGDATFIHSTYNDARSVLPESVIANIESRRERDPNWWRVYGLGLVGKLEGLIHPNFTTIKEFPEEGIEGYGLDFGFNDPVAMVRCKIVGDEIISDELIYETGMTNQDIDKKMTEIGLIKGRSEIIADSAEPKSIEELYRMGWNIKPSIKGPDSVVAGIQKVNQYKQVWTDQSTNGIKEQRNYMWDRDKNGKILDSEKKSQFNHLMSARRYWLSHVTMGCKKIFKYNQGDEKKFVINWGNNQSANVLHYAAFCLMPNSCLYTVFSLWDKKLGNLFIYRALKYDSIDPSAIADDIIRTAHLKTFMINRLLCNEMFLAEGRSVARLISDALKIKGVTKSFSKPVQIDMYGAIAYLNVLFNKKMIVIHEDLMEFSSSISGWTFKENENDLTESGYCEALCLISTELKQDIAKEAKKRERPDYPDQEPREKKVSKSWQIV